MNNFSFSSPLSLNQPLTHYTITTTAGNMCIYWITRHTCGHESVIPTQCPIKRPSASNPFPNFSACYITESTVNDPGFCSNAECVQKLKAQTTKKLAQREAAAVEKRMKKHPRVLMTRATRKWMRRPRCIPSKILEMPEENVPNKNVPGEHIYWDSESIWALYHAEAVKLAKAKATMREVVQVPLMMALPPGRKKKMETRSDEQKHRLNHRDRMTDLRVFYMNGGVKDLSNRQTTRKPISSRKLPRPLVLSRPPRNVESPKLTPSGTSHAKSPAWTQVHEMAKHTRKSTEVSEIPNSLHPGSTHYITLKQTRKSVEVSEIPMSLRPGSAYAPMPKPNPTMNTMTANIGRSFAERMANRQKQEMIASTRRVERRQCRIFELDGVAEAAHGAPLAPKMPVRLSAVGMHELYTAPPSATKEMAVVGAKSGEVLVPPAELASTKVVKADVPKLPNLRRVSRMRFDGTVLAQVG